MKYLAILCLSFLLSGCGWFNRNTNTDGTSPNNNVGNNTNGQNNIPTSSMNDLFTYFNESGLSIANAKDIDVVDINAHEGKMFEYENNPVYIYRMKINDEKIKTWMDEIKNTGKVTINQNGKDETYDALINGEYMMVSKSGTNLNKLSEMFKKYEVK
ncbi:MAG: hypothetical protein ACI4U3_01775 [Traorella sp.]